MKLYGLMVLAPFLVACSNKYIVTDPVNNMAYESPHLPNNAIITGNLKTSGGIFGPDHTMYISAIDGESVLYSRLGNHTDTWNNVYPISAGTHTITATYKSGGFSVVPTALSFAAQPNRTYQLDFATDRGTDWLNTPEYVDVWIMDKATGQRVSEVIRTMPTSGFELPSFSIGSSETVN